MPSTRTSVLRFGSRGTPAAFSSSSTRLCAEALAGIADPLFPALATARVLKPDAAGRAILAGMTTFWLCRLLAQFVAYDCAIWRGDRFRTFMHVACSLLWCYVSATYGIAFVTVRN